MYIYSPGVDGDSASVVKLDAELLKTEVMGVWPPAHAHKEDVSLHLLGLAVLNTLHTHADLAISLLGSHHLGVELKLDPLLSHDSLELFAHVHVNTHASNMTQELNSSDLSAESGPDGAKLHSNDSGSDEDHLLRNLLETQSSGGAHNRLLIDLDTGERGDLGAGGNHDVLGVDHLGDLAIRSEDRHLVRAGDGAMALKVGDLVPLKQHLNAPGQSRDSFLLLSHHLLEVKADLTGDNASVGEVTVLGHVIVVGVVEEGLAGDAAHVKAGTAQGRIFLDTDSLHPELGRLDGSDVASGAGSNDNKVNIVMGGVVTSLE